jgi:hypothetical protein
LGLFAYETSLDKNTISLQGIRGENAKVQKCYKIGENPQLAIDLYWCMSYSREGLKHIKQKPDVPSSVGFLFLEGI